MLHTDLTSLISSAEVWRHRANTRQQIFRTSDELDQMSSWLRTYWDLRMAPKLLAVSRSTSDESFRIVSRELSEFLKMSGESWLQIWNAGQSEWSGNPNRYLMLIHWFKMQPELIHWNRERTRRRKSTKRYKRKKAEYDASYKASYDARPDVRARRRARADLINAQKRARYARAKQNILINYSELIDEN